MGFFSAIFGSGTKKTDAQRMQSIARGQSIIGNVAGSSPYMQQWRRENKSLHEEYVKQEKNMRKQWERADIETNRSLQKEKERYFRKYKDPKDAERFYAKYETNARRDIQRDRKKETDSMRWEKVDRQRDISKNIKQWR